MKIIAFSMTMALTLACGSANSGSPDGSAGVADGAASDGGDCLLTSPAIGAYGRCTLDGGGAANQCPPSLICTADSARQTDFCVVPCSNSSNCPWYGTHCVNGACLWNGCDGGPGSACNALGSADGTCIPPEGGAVVGACLPPGTSAAACSPRPTCADPSALCAQGWICTAPGGGAGKCTHF
jgi:hypothetical protein